jgi:hypothetical protein
MFYNNTMVTLKNPYTIQITDTASITISPNITGVIKNEGDENHLVEFTIIPGISIKVMVHKSLLSNAH